MIIQITFKLNRPFPGKFIEKYPFYGIIYVRSLQKTPKKVKFLTSSKKKVCLQKMCIFTWRSIVRILTKTILGSVLAQKPNFYGFPPKCACVSTPPVTDI